ncbi:MAG: orotate phosphoribosyltransferase [Sphingomonadaceae bacterium]|nr:orotate phosphoribosyltransferase [Sphingomonadaceae bacterium]
MATVTLTPFSDREGDDRLSSRGRPGRRDADRRELLAIVKARSFKTGDFTLASGKRSNLYFNMKPTMMDPRGAELVALAFLAIIEAVDAEYVSGLEIGAVPSIGSIAALSSTMGKPVRTTFVRKAAKEHGTRELIEGLGPDESLAGKRVLVVDDVATSGGSILQAIEAVRAAGGEVTDGACIVDRNEGGRELLARHGVTLHAILHASDFVGSA